MISLTAIGYQKIGDIYKCQECTFLFHSLIFVPTDNSEQPPFHIDNWHEGHILLSNDFKTKFMLEDFKSEKVFEYRNISTLLPFDKLVISVYTENEIIETICSRILVQLPKGKQGNCDGGFTSFFPSILEKDNEYYNLPPISLPANCIKCEICQHFPPRTWSYKTDSQCNLIPNKEFKDNNKPDGYFYPHYHNVYCFTEFLSLKIYNRHTLLITGSKRIDYKEYTIYSHSSMDPEPEKGSETTYAELNTFVEFSTNAELLDFFKNLNPVALESSDSLFQVKFSDVIELCKKLDLYLFTHNRTDHQRW